MNEIILLDGTHLIFARGAFDNWCVYHVLENGTRIAPKDIDYFNDLFTLAQRINAQDIYNDFVTVYNMTGNQIEQAVINQILNISNINRYEHYNQEIFRIFSILYMGMIAEENKKNTRLGKRIKRLGMHMLLIEEQNPQYCADFMTGMTWQEIDQICHNFGF